MNKNTIDAVPAESARERGEQITRLGIVGVGQMGAGIAQSAVAAGFRVVVVDCKLSLAQRGRSSILERWDKAVSQGKLESAARDRFADALTVAPDIPALAAAEPELVIEAVPENPDVKFETFAELGMICPPSTVLASNTSSISITKLAARTRHPERVGGMHFMHPVPVMKLVEVIRGLQTDDATFHIIRSIAVRMGKTVIVARDTPGFAVNRILMPMINEAVFALDEGIASAEDIDAALTLGANHPMGPLTLADFIGLDTCLAILNVLHQEIGDPKYRPCPLLKQYVAAGWLGRKTGKGFYSHPPKKPDTNAPT